MSCQLLICTVQGTDLGPLQGIPYGLKDLIAVDGYRTTWGMPAFVDQVLVGSAHVYQRQTSSANLPPHSIPKRHARVPGSCHLAAMPIAMTV